MGGTVLPWCDKTIYIQDLLRSKSPDIIRRPFRLVHTACVLVYLYRRISQPSSVVHLAERSTYSTLLRGISQEVRFTVFRRSGSFVICRTASGSLAEMLDWERKPLLQTYVRPCRMNEDLRYGCDRVCD